MLSVNTNTYRWSISTYDRLFETSILPDLDKVIHIDCNTIITDSLKAIRDVDMSNAIAVGAPDYLCDGHKVNLV